MTTMTAKICCICKAPSLGGLGHTYLLCGGCMDAVEDIQPEKRHDYVRLRTEGQTHNIAAMLAEQKAPQGIGDKTFLAGVNPGGNQFSENPALGDYYAQEARAAGVNISGATYLSTCASRPGDPRAWVRDRGDIRRLMEERGWQCEGDVKVRFREEDDAPAAGPGVAPDLVEEAIADRLAAEPELRPSEELWHETRQEIKPSWAE